MYKWIRCRLENFFRPFHFIVKLFFNGQWVIFLRHRQIGTFVLFCMPLVWWQLKSYLYGIYAFGLNETNQIERAEKEAQVRLEMNERTIHGQYLSRLIH